MSRFGRHMLALLGLAFVATLGVERLSSATEMAGDATPGTGTPAAVRTVEVVIERFVYEPRRIEVAPGTRVVWTNRDGAPHTVTIPGDFDSGRISKGGTYERVFTEPGSYLYECFYHQNMTGRVVVVPVAASPEASPVS